MFFRGETAPVVGKIDRGQGGQMVQECRYFSEHVGLDVVVFDCRDPDFPDEKTDFLLIDAGELIFVIRCQDYFAKKV